MQDAEIDHLRVPAIILGKGNRLSQKPSMPHLYAFVDSFNDLCPVNFPVNILTMMQYKNHR